MTRADWSAEQPRCWLCGKPAGETHEIACGSGRHAALKEPASWIRACHQCHQGNGGLHDYRSWPPKRQLALKWLCDPANYNRRAVNLLRGQQPNAITHAEVMGQVPYVVARLMRNGVSHEDIEAQLDARDEQ